MPGVDPNAGGGTTTTPTGDGGSSSSSSSSGGSSKPEPKTQSQVLAERRAARAFAELQRSYLETLRRWGIRATPNLMNLVARGVKGAWSTSMFSAMLRHTPEYRQRFRGIQWKTGMTEGSYLSTYAQYKARAQDVGMQFSRNMFAKALRKGVDFEEFSDRVDALQTFKTYEPMWNQFQTVLQERGINVPGGTLGRKEMVKFIMGRGSKQWESVFQEVYLTTNLEKVAGLSVVEPGKDEVATPDSMEISRGELLNIIKQVEGVSAGKFDVESITPQQFSEIGQRLRKYPLSYLRRYGLTYSDILKAELGGPGASETMALGEKILAEKEFTNQPRPTSRTPALEQQQQAPLPQSL